MNEKEEAIMQKDSTLLSSSMNEKLQELELLLQSRDRKINFLEEEHKKEVVRASEAENISKNCRYGLLPIGVNLEPNNLI